MKIFDVEYTDTFGGQANYSWVRREVIEADEDLSNLALMRRAKAAVGLTGARGRSESYGDTLEFRPYGMATVMFVTYRDT